MREAKEFSARLKRITFFQDVISIWLVMSASTLNCIGVSRSTSVSGTYRDVARFRIIAVQSTSCFPPALTEA